MITHPQEVLKIFSTFYKDLLSSPQPSIDQSSRLWIDDISLPSLTPQQKESLSAPCTELELTRRIKSLKISTAPGPDGFSSSYYKKFAPLLTPHLTNLFNHILNGGQFPNEMLLANLSLPIHGLPSSELHHHQLIRRFYAECFALSTNPSNTVFEQICISLSRDRGLISKLYNFLNSAGVPEKSSQMIKWESDLGITFSMDDWMSMSINLRKSNKAISFRETPTKVFSRWYLTPVKLHSYYPSVSPNCFRGCSVPGTFIHIFWSCPYLDLIWR